MRPYLPYLFSMLVILFSALSSYSIITTPNAGELVLVVPFWNIVACIVGWGVFSVSWSNLNGVPQPGRLEKTGPTKMQSFLYVLLAIGTHVVMYSVV